jgi:hypothetical protein
MAGGDEPANGGRVTTREFYDMQLKTNERMDNMERRIIARLDVIAGCVPQIETNKEEIDTLRKKSDVWNSLNSLGVMVGTTFSALWKNGG